MKLTQSVLPLSHPYCKTPSHATYNQVHAAACRYQRMRRKVHDSWHHNHECTYMYINRPPFAPKSTSIISEREKCHALIKVQIGARAGRGERDNRSKPSAATTSTAVSEGRLATYPLILLASFQIQEYGGNNSQPNREQVSPHDAEVRKLLPRCKMHRCFSIASVSGQQGKEETGNQGGWRRGEGAGYRTCLAGYMIPWGSTKVRRLMGSHQETNGPSMGKF